jgi:hypothetical protein
MKGIIGNHHSGVKGHYLFSIGSVDLSGLKLIPNRRVFVKDKWRYLTFM